MAYSEAWYKFLEGLEIIKVDGKFCLKNNPQVLYDTREKAEQAAKTAKDIINF